MPLVYITGVSGTGKSTVMQTLRGRGYEAHGVDEEGYADWINRETGQAEALPGKHIDMHQWYKNHHEVLNVQRVTHLYDEARKQRKPVFLCGSAKGEREVWRCFDLAVVLLVDKRTLRRRIARRINSVFGKRPRELASLLRWRAKHNARYYHALGAITVDATKRIGEVVDEILAITKARL